jgi:hypothetical protein
MLTCINWFVPGFVGASFTHLGCLKLYGFGRGIVGGHDKPIAQQLCGT